ncbi:recombinase family protein [Streptomyces sp. NPDC088816]|uniref:recombinase family protein n=2 Tax=unclassified Streptomyces TaxID=2593676 RepID=UPI0038212AC6
MQSAIHGLESGKPTTSTDMACGELRTAVDVINPVARVYEDNDLSAYKRKTVRPEFRQMLEDLRAGRIDGVVAWDIDRFTRRPRELEAWIDEYEEGERRRRRLVFDSVSAPDIDLSTENGRFIARIKVTIANKSSADTSRRTKRRPLEPAAQGKPPGGRAPYGWNREDRRTLVPDEAENLRKADKALANVQARAPEWTKEEQLAYLEGDMAGFKQAWQEKRMSAARYIAHTEDLEKQIAGPHRERAPHRAEAATFVAGPIDIRERWERPAIEQRRAAVLKVFRAVVIKPASNGPIFDPADIEQLERTGRGIRAAARSLSHSLKRAHHR